MARNWKITVGDCREVLKTWPENSVDSIVTDPPYGLTQNKKGGSGEASLNLDSPAGQSRVTTGGGFMGQKWDASVPGIEFWKEMLRVAKPGAHLLAFGGDRTHHRMMVAIEDAGWELRTCLYWIFGQGFPKALSVSKAIDREAGVDRPVIGTRTDGCGNTDSSIHKTEGFAASRETVFEVTAPATEAAKQWEGWFTALKPAAEIIVLARKPLDGTVAQNVQRFGTGALNIDGCRIKNVAPGKQDRSDEPGADDRGDAATSFKPTGGPRDGSALGRWPATVILSHSPDCKLVGTKIVKGRAINRFTDGAKPFGGGAGHPFDSEQLPDEEVEVYECAPDCPIGMLPESGSGAENIVIARRQRNKGWCNSSPGEGVLAIDNYGDSGSAARFFYTAKVSKFEREEGCQFLPSKTGAEAVNREEGSAGTKSPRAGSGRTASRVHNFHVSVKPIDLMQYLVRLVTPRGGLVLDPFLGSGSTGIAAIREGMQFHGIELSADYARIAEARMGHYLL